MGDIFDGRTRVGNRSAFPERIMAAFAGGVLSAMLGVLLVSAVFHSTEVCGSAAAKGCKEAGDASQETVCAQARKTDGSPGCRIMKPQRQSTRPPS